MDWRARLVTALGAAVLLVMAAPPPAQAQFCSTNANCSEAMTCQSWFLGWRRCARRPCNDDNGCPADRNVCWLGTCQRGCRADDGCGVGRTCVAPADGGVPTCVGPGPSPPSSSLAGEGRRCGRVDMGGVIKSVGCLPGLSCQNGTCRRLQQ